MLIPGLINSKFMTYWAEMDLCRRAGAYWALLHIAVCLPDICSALQAPNGETKGHLYIAWCNRHLSDPLLKGDERWAMRCKVLHQGRASTGGQGRYAGFSFGQPAPGGQVSHGPVDSGGTLSLDVGLLSDGVRHGVDHWIQELEANPNRAKATNTERNLGSLVQVRQFTVPTPGPIMPGGPSFVIINKTS